MVTVSLHRQILEAVQDAIQAIDLEDITSDNVVILKENKRIERQEIGIPGIGIMHSGESEQIGGPEHGATNVHEVLGYPVIVCMFDLDREDGQPSQDLWHDRRLYWRQQIIQTFVGQPLMANVCQCTMSPRPIMIPQEWKERSLWVSPLLFYFWGRLTRA